MEVNLLRFLAVLKFSDSRKAEVQTLKYFLPQALGSAFLLIGILCVIYQEVFFLNALLLKLGLVPFHFWFIRVSKRISFFGLWIISIPQKLIPFRLMLHCWTTTIYYLNFFIVFLGSMVCIISVSQTTRIRIILGYSSLFNRRWMVLVLDSGDVLFLVFSLYGISLALLTNFLAQKKMFISGEINQQTNSWGELFKLILLLLNLGGIPPLLNIWRKAVLIHYFLHCGDLVYLLSFVSVSVFLTYIYLSICLAFGFFSSIRFHFSFETPRNVSFWGLILSSACLFFF